MKALQEPMAALMHALGQSGGGPPGRSILGVNVIAHSGLDAWRGRLVPLHWNQAAARELEEGGFAVTREEAVSGRTFDEVWLLPDRQRECQLGELAFAWEALAEGGRLLVSVRNDWGAKRLEERWRDVCGSEVACVSKHHCRVFESVKRAGAAKTGDIAAWKTAASLQRLPGSGFWSRPGLFSWQEPDLGSSLLASQLPETLGGAVADLGAGWGRLGMEILKRCPEVRSLDCFEIDLRAIEPARRNLGNVMVPVRPRLHWKDVTAGVGRAQYDCIVMNPPFHEGRDAEPELGLKFIAAAATALKRQGELWLVANRQLPYEALLEEMFAEAALVVEKHGFKVLRATGVRDKVHAAGNWRRKRR